ncbi:MAG: magnesium/cobalt transporter CorA [Armatimonadota bacterium]|nr:magnesium/cobalt transporter CorA [Armatimonadota bacterium]
MIKSYLFTQDEVKEDVPLDEWRSLVKGDCALLWIDARAISREDMNLLAEKFGLHNFAVRSCLDEFTRPHVYEFSDHLYANMTTIEKDGDHGIRPAELNLFAGGKFIITAAKTAESPAVDEALEEYKETPGLCARGPMYAIYLLAEYLVETYFPVVEKMDDDADGLEDDMLNRADKQSLQRLFDAKRRVFEVRRLLGPQRDIFSELGRRDFDFLEGENRIYFQDAYSKMIRIFDMLDTIREILSGSLDVYLSSVSNRLNEIVKVLTVASIILMTLSFITGFYGMNFTHLPWLHAPNAFRNAIILMAAIVAVMLVWFRRKGWI